MAAVFLVALCVAVPSPGDGARADVFTVERVAADATAANAIAARERAIATGQEAALERLFDRMIPRDQRAALPRPASSETADLVRDFAVEDEKTSAVRYLASLTVRFAPEAIRALLRTANVPFAETMSKPVVIVPVLRSGAAPSLWEEGNPWLRAWQANERAGLVPFIAPLGDLDDVVALDAATALAGERDGLAALSWRYQAGSVIVAMAEPRQRDGMLTVQLTTSRFNSAGESEGTQVRSISAEGATPEAQWARAAALMAEGIEESWKRANLIRFDSERSLVATVPLTQLADLLEVRRRLAEVSFLRSYDILYLARGAAQIRLNYFGDERQLATALEQSDLLLEQGAADWILRRAKAPQRAAADRALQPPR